jgi:hypothetical protein
LGYTGTAVAAILFIVADVLFIATKHKNGVSNGEIAVFCSAVYVVRRLDMSNECAVYWKNDNAIYLASSIKQNAAQRGCRKRTLTFGSVQQMLASPCSKSLHEALFYITRQTRLRFQLFLLLPAIRRKSAFKKRFSGQ